MRMKTLCAGLLALPLAASAQLTEIPEFTGQFSETFEGKSGGQCITPAVFEGHGELCSAAMLISSIWSFQCDIRAFEGSAFAGSAAGVAEYTFTEPVSRFGGYFGTNALAVGEPTDLGRVEFYDEFGGLIGEGILALDDMCGWHWLGWESEEPVFSIIVRGSSGGFVDMDAMQIDIDGGTTTCYADCDESGTLDFFDFLCFQNSFAALETYADCDESGQHDFFDFLCFQTAFAEGCP